MVFLPGSLWSAHWCVCWFGPGGNSKAEGGGRADTLPRDGSAPPPGRGSGLLPPQCWLLPLLLSKAKPGCLWGQTLGKARATRQVVLLAAWFRWKPEQCCGPRGPRPEHGQAFFILSARLKSAPPCVASDLPGGRLTHLGTGSPSCQHASGLTG